LPCIFCIAVFLIAATAVTAATLDQMEDRLEQAASEPVERETDTESATVWNATFKVGRKDAPVRITVYKDYGRVRIQVLTHALSREQVEELQDRIAELLGLRIIDRSSEDDEEQVREAHDAEAEAEADAEERPEQEEPEPVAQDEEARRAQERQQPPAR
jgi:hypothetical protein